MRRVLAILGSTVAITALASGCGSCGSCNSCGWGGSSYATPSYSAPSYGGPTLAPQSGGVYYDSQPQYSAPAQNGSSGSNGSYTPSPTPQTQSYSAPAYQGSGTR